MSNEKNNNNLNKDELEDVAGGWNGQPINPTWIPVDESCFLINKGDHCLNSVAKGHKDNCFECKHYNK